MHHNTSMRTVLTAIFKVNLSYLVAPWILTVQLFWKRTSRNNRQRSFTGKTPFCHTTTTV